jgi:hypothetical protein
MAERPQARAFIPYEIPLGGGGVAGVVLPADLTQEEAARVCRVIQSIAMPDASAFGVGTGADGSTEESDG